MEEPKKIVHSAEVVYCRLNKLLSMGVDADVGQLTSLQYSMSMLRPGQPPVIGQVRLRRWDPREQVFVQVLQAVQVLQKSKNVPCSS